MEQKEELRARLSKCSDIFKRINYNIFLIGFMGSGKTTISEYLNNTFAMKSVEMDCVIAEREGMSISDIFAVHGEEYFRSLETNLLIEMQAESNVVVSCGGGCADAGKKYC